MQMFIHQIKHSKGTHHKYQKTLHRQQQQIKHLQTEIKLTRPLEIATIKMEMISQERPPRSEPTGTTFRKIIASIEKVLKTTKSLSKKEESL